MMSSKPVWSSLLVCALHSSKHQLLYLPVVMHSAHVSKPSQKTFRIFPGNFTKNFDFSRKISEQFQFFQAISSKNFNFPGINFRMISFSVYPDKIGHLQLLLRKLFYFSSKVTIFEYFLYMIIFHDLLDPPSTTPQSPHKIWG